MASSRTTRSATLRTIEQSFRSRLRKTKTAGAYDFDPKHRVGHLLRRAYYRAKGSASALLRAEGITAMQAAAIMVLHDHGSISQAELGRTIGMEPANVHGLIARLRSGGLLELHADERDNRKTNVSLSPSGRRRAARIATLTAEAAEMTLDVFNDREREQFFALLNRYAFADEG